MADLPPRRVRLAAALAFRGAELFVATQRPNQLYLLAGEQHEDPSSVISRPNCAAILFAHTAGEASQTVLFPGVWISNACSDLLSHCEVVPNRLGDPPPEDQLAVRLAAMGPRRVVFDQLPPKMADAIRAVAPDVELVEDDFLTTLLRRRKDEADLTAMREAARVADLGMQAAFAQIRPGATCGEAIAVGTAAMLAAGAESVAMAPASGQGTWYLDSAEDPRRIIEEGDMVFIDMGIWVHGYLGDMTRAAIVGTGSAQQQDLLATVQDAYRSASRRMVHGARASDIYQGVVDLYEAKGWAPYFVHHLSHGLGLGGDVPRVADGSDEVLQMGDALSCEPGCYVPDLGGARVENMIWISDAGPVELTTTPIDPELGT
ncbi:MAG: aminopeptidase P family protein [Gemmatimonadetes bacterium]|jgi:Xaa-Pro aminopeptidase|nr:aminopeptidase P family protein [Gemmatimonadota bacterium]MBT6145388.1 aminopeptidase P family protein [Gemmatimonadota bacterium]MBT7861373.1 aminopeptidase P family protein [Gemmatimonadota bacterium]